VVIRKTRWKHPSSSAPASKTDAPAVIQLGQIGTPDSEIVRLGGLKLVPGMPVEAFIQTTPRTMISYLVRPIHDQVIRAFREK
jgi:hypothetical protein